MDFQGENFCKMSECKWTKFAQPLIFVDLRGIKTLMNDQKKDLPYPAEPRNSISKSAGIA